VWTKIRQDSTCPTKLAVSLTGQIPGSAAHLALDAAKEEKDIKFSYEFIEP